MAKKKKSKSAARMLISNRWANATARAWQPPEIDEHAAQKTWRGLSFERKMEVVEEVVTTRSIELHLAYTGILSINAGKKSQKGTVGKKLRDEIPAVIFAVRKKLSQQEGKARPRTNLVPEELYAVVDVRGKRRICAVPTDLVDAKACTGFKTQTGSNKPRQEQIFMKHPDHSKRLKGVITCCVNLPRERNRDPTHMLSCRHVFGMIDYVGSAKPPDTATVCNKSSGVIGKPTTTCGKLKTPGIENRCDVAIGRVDSSIRVRRAIKGLSVERFANGWDEFPKKTRFLIRTPEGVLEASYVDRGSFGVEYNFKGTKSVVIMPNLIKAEVYGKETRGGWSGAPFISRKRNGVLLGMHIAGEGNIALMIPGWILRDYSYYNFGGNQRSGLLTTYPQRGQ